MKKIIIILIVLAVISTGGYFGYKKFFAASVKKVDYETFVIKKDSITKSVFSTGRVEANLEVEIKCKASGEVIKLPYNISDRVKKGSMLLKLNPVSEQLSVKKGELRLIDTQTSLEKAEQEMEIFKKTLDMDIKKASLALDLNLNKLKDAENNFFRKKKASDKGFLSKEDFDKANLELIQARNDVNKAKMDLKEKKEQVIQIKSKEIDIKSAKSKIELEKISFLEAHERLKETEIYSPIDGIVVSRNVQIGQIISSGISGMSGGTTVMTIADLSKIFVSASVDESDIGKIKINDEVNITVDAYPDEKFQGKVIQIASKGTVSGNVVIFQIKIEVTAKNKELLKSEMTASVEIITDTKKDVLVVSNDSLIRKNNRFYVKVFDNNNEKIEKPLKVGLKGNETTEVIKGLKPGEKVIIDEDDKKSKWKKDEEDER